ncbi:hypothetical protein ACWEJ6_33875 [Nonomuraea sp. NPDC004702]
MTRGQEGVAGLGQPVHAVQDLAHDHQAVRLAGPVLQLAAQGQRAVQTGLGVVKASHLQVEAAEVAQIDGLGQGVGDGLVQHEGPFEVFDGLAKHEIAFQVIDSLAKPEGAFQVTDGLAKHAQVAYVAPALHRAAVRASCQPVSSTRRMGLHQAQGLGQARGPPSSAGASVKRRAFA